MKDGLGIFLWKLSVGLYLLANGALALFVKKGLGIGKSSDFEIMLKSFNFNNDTIKVFVVIFGVIAFVAGVCIILEMLGIDSISFLLQLIFIIAIIWAVYIIVGLISWIMDGFENFWPVLQRLAVHTMVFSSLLVASGKGSR